MTEFAPNFLYYSPFFADIFAPAFVDYFPRYSFELLSMMVGHNKEGVKVPLNRIGMMARFDTGGCSSKNFKSFNQQRFSPVLKRYDYESVAENIKHYGSPIPPDIPVGNLEFSLQNVEMLLITGAIDDFCQDEDV